MARLIFANDIEMPPSFDRLALSTSLLDGGANFHSGLKITD